MEPESVRFFDGHKYMWDGVTYAAREDAAAKKADYESQNFEVRVVEQDDQFFVYTRRVVTEVKVEGAPPA